MNWSRKEVHFFVVVFCTLSVGSCFAQHHHNQGGKGSGSSSGFASVVKHVMKNGTNASTNPQDVPVPINKIEHFRIIGGVETARNEFPFIVSFSRHGNHFCGGAIIVSSSSSTSSEWILTAAHCASEPTFDVTAGEHNLNMDEGTEQKSRAVLVIRNANYNPVTYEDDICLVKVSPPFKFDKYVQPFAVPSTHFVANGDATVAGWGTEDEAFQIVSPVLRKVTVPLVPSLECSSQYGSFFHPLKMVCCGLAEGGKDACQGDSGGPLMCEDSHSGRGAILCGIVSFGLGCGRPELAGVYTKVAYYSDWIEFQMRTNSGNSKGGPPAQPKWTTQYRPPRPTTVAPPVTPAPGNLFPEIPPGYVVIIKPVSAAPPQQPVYVHRHNITRGKPNSSIVHSSNKQFIVFASVALVLFFKVSNSF